MMNDDLLTITKLQRGADRAARRYLDRNPWISVEDVVQETLVSLDEKKATIRCPYWYAYSIAQRLCFKINIKHRNERAELKKYASGVEFQYEETSDDSIRLQDCVASLFTLEKDTALTLLMKFAKGCSYNQLPEQLEVITGEHRSASYYRLKVNAGIEAMRKVLLDIPR